ncbi:hypothetical protein DVH24_035787, partial [Malus domestica]
VLARPPDSERTSKPPSIPVISFLVQFDPRPAPSSSSSSSSAISCSLSVASCSPSYAPLVYKVPKNDIEALKSPLIGLFQKFHARKFILYVQDYSETDLKTHEGMDLTRMTTRDLIADDRYLNEPALDTMKRMKVLDLSVDLSAASAAEE